MSKTRDTIQEEAIEAIGDNHRCTVAISMRVGKTRIGVTDFSKMSENSKALVVYPKLTVKTAWLEELEKTNNKHLLDRITFSTYVSLKKQDLDYDVVYFDEVHNILETHEEWLTNYTGRILGLTGTLPHQRNIKYKLIQKYCPIVYEYLVNEAVTDGILNDYRIKVHMIPLSRYKLLEIKTKTNKIFRTSEYDSYVWWSNKVNLSVSDGQKMTASIGRMTAMKKFNSKNIYLQALLNSITDKCIVFADTHVQAMKACKHTFISGNDDSGKNLEMFKSGEITKLACVLQLSEGITIPNLKQCIITHAYGNNHKTAQRLARCLSLNPDEMATVHILCYKDTVDELWVEQALSNFDQDKIEYIN